MPRKKARQNRLKRFALLILVILLIAVPIAIGYIWYGLSNRPLVDYTFGGTSQVRLYYRLNASTQNYPGTIDLAHALIRNRGRLDISVIVTIHAVNALVSVSYYGPYNEMASQLIPLPADSGYQIVTFYLTLISQVTNFSIKCDVGRVVDLSTFSSSVSTTFGEIQPVSPTLLQYSHESTSPFEYQLVHQS